MQDAYIVIGSWGKLGIPDSKRYNAPENTPCRLEGVWAGTGGRVSLKVVTRLLACGAQPLLD